MRIAIGNDHAALDARVQVMDLLSQLGHEAVDFGTAEEGSVDYPDFALAVALAVRRGDADLGILICGTGIGMSIAANKVRGIRAALCHSEVTARMARLHNDAQILCLGARVLDAATVETCVRVFLATAFEGGRHARRVAKMMAIEEERDGQGSNN